MPKSYNAGFFVFSDDAGNVAFVNEKTGIPTSGCALAKGMKWNGAKRTAATKKNRKSQLQRKLVLNKLQKNIEPEIRLLIQPTLAVEKRCKAKIKGVYQCIVPNQTKMECAVGCGKNRKAIYKKK